MTIPTETSEQWVWPMFLDTETTGLHPYYHEIWEVALISKEGPDGWRERRWFLDVNLAAADPIALQIGGFHKRHPMGHDFEQSPTAEYQQVTDVWTFAEEFAKLTYGEHLACAIPSFDIPRLDDLLRKNHCLPEWHYHTICVESMLLGKYGISPPWKSEDLLNACGIGIDPELKHTALGDARWVRDVWLHCHE